MHKLIRSYGLAPHPEGGYFKRIHCSRQAVDAPATGLRRQAVTHIYFLLLQGEVSRFHRLRHDEIWNFYEGSPLRLVSFDGTGIQQRILGPGTGYAAVVEGGLFQAAESLGDYSLVGCTVAPGFEFEDFNFLTDCPDLTRNLGENFPAFRRFL
ncbi:MAG: cupin domain-containing protein [Deltaproteobacteria bacterium]|nr:cupin domain-containing protein [Deltaproteobacteria bacterium]